MIVGMHHVIPTDVSGPWRAVKVRLAEGVAVRAERRRVAWLPFVWTGEEVGRVRFERDQSVNPDLDFDAALERVTARARQRVAVLNNWSTEGQGYTPNKEDQDATTG